jgi:hypothetical protein
VPLFGKKILSFRSGIMRDEDASAQRRASFIYIGRTAKTTDIFTANNKQPPRGDCLFMEKILRFYRGMLGGKWQR